MKLLWSIGLLIMLPQISFKDAQKKYQRVNTAYQEKESMVKKYFSDKNLNYPGFHLFIRALKKEMKLEAWVKEKDKSNYVLLHTYDFCSTSGTLGPKRKEGDLQIPEGVYHISHFNPLSNFYLSLGINYPNKYDLQMAGQKNPGGAIYIHGNCVTVGCIPITDEKIKELYVLAVEAKNNGQEKIPVHIFPTHLTADQLKKLEKDFASFPSYISFWKNLKSVYDHFEQSGKPGSVVVNTSGYRVD
jgi:murein L,D-transpeptidase YafK